MDADGLPIVGPGVDYTKVDAIQQKRSIAFINHFITHTARFLNRFSCVCEEKLENLSTKIQRLEISLSILEAKLSSIPGLENVTVESSSSSTSVATNGPGSSEASATSQNTAVNNEPSDTATPAAAQAPPPEEVKPQQTVSQDPRYARFFKMLQVGVPAQAVKLKMSAEGLNPDLLDTPDAAITDGGGGGGATNNKDDSDDDFSDDNNSDSDSVSSFSD
ncbi:WASH complex subunit 3 isoform X2 [Patella vulgata]|uniref:WASH complex subunit 3 isoform X2 n=1 Tax=Patella vulgata TaxID=6465 RepID=UPI00217FF782|nr:WASH complex subunit 3 isoform X2 [Patella vulgata]